ncbi:uncharacterized protein LOC106465483 [Limulus polyphemus]|uniref:Uncharacterized protein LOC106465483 n=1 Tax=Limulus polyphemus TaxID=6850 RepID=A0ABM1BFU8_LIMPO|nr:uncharacterized protein LOC106465483 [Limulus polyphemus]
MADQASDDSLLEASRQDENKNEQHETQEQPNSPCTKPEDVENSEARSKTSGLSEASGATQENHRDFTEGERDEDTGSSVLPRKKTQAPKEPAVIYTNIDGVAATKQFVEAIQDKLNEEEKLALRDLEEYMLTESGAWALGATHLDLIGKVLLEDLWPVEVKLLTLRLLQAAAFKDDVILLLHQDRKDHYVMRYVSKIEDLSGEEQEELTKLLCNLCHQGSSFDWLMYISEWESESGHSSNSRATIRASVHALLSDRPSVKEKGVSLMYNLARKELFDDTATELAMAVLQFLQGELSEEEAFYCLTSLLKFMYISFNEVPTLMQMLGPDVDKFGGKSERVDQLIEQIKFKLSISASAS